MRVAFHVEGTTDQVVLCDFVEKIVGRAVEPHVYRKRAGGWAAAIATMVPAVWQAWQLGCVGAIVVVDADSTTPHELHAPDAPGDCRHCLLRSMLPRLPPRGDGSMTIVTAVPVQAIEAWLLAFGEHLLRQSVGRRNTCTAMKPGGCSTVWCSRRRARSGKCVNVCCRGSTPRHWIGWRRARSRSATSAIK